MWIPVTPSLEVQPPLHEIDTVIELIYGLWIGCDNPERKLDKNVILDPRCDKCQILMKAAIDRQDPQLSMVLTDGVRSKTALDAWLEAMEFVGG